MVNTFPSLLSLCMLSSPNDCHCVAGASVHSLCYKIYGLIAEQNQGAINTALVWPFCLHSIPSMQLSFVLPQLLLCNAVINSLLYLDINIISHPRRSQMDISSSRIRSRAKIVNHKLDSLISETHSCDRVIFIENVIWVFNYANFLFHIQMLHISQNMFTEFSQISK